jgi:glutaredoxin
LIKENLTSWNISFEEINISNDDEGKQFLKSKGHRFVPQLYLKDFNVNHNIDTQEFTEEVFYDRLDQFIASHSQEDIQEIIEEYDKKNTST